MATPRPPNARSSSPWPRTGRARRWRGLGEALYLQCDYPAAAAYYERADAAFRRERDLMAAGRAARMVAWITGNVLGDWALRSGWLARASAILEEAGEDGPDRGWVLMIRAFSEPDAQVRESLSHEAIAIGRRFGDPDLEFMAVAYLGGVYLMVDRVEEGLALCDEAMAALLAGELTEFATVDEIFCGLFWGCELVDDVPRADQWIRAATERMRRSNVVAAFCRAHYGGILTAAGRWDQAEVELLEAARLLEGLEHHSDAVRALAALRLAKGEVALARDLLERATDAPDDEIPTVGEFTLVGPLLALLVDVHLEEGNVDAAARAAERLDRIAREQRGPYLKAAAALAKGRVCAASGEGDARACLHEALEGFARAQLPMELALTRLELARALAEGSPEVAIAEAKLALQDFERLEATRHADATAALLRLLGAPIRTGPKGDRRADQAGGGGARAHRGRIVQPRDRRPPLHHPQDR